MVSSLGILTHCPISFTLPLSPLSFWKQKLKLQQQGIFAYSSDGVTKQLQMQYHLLLAWRRDDPELHVPRENKVNFNQICDLANRDKYTWLSVNESVSNLI